MESLIKQHVTGAHLLSRGASEIVFRLPKEDSSRRDPSIALSQNSQSPETILFSCIE